MRLIVLLTAIAVIGSVQCGKAPLLQKRWAALSYGGERYQFKQSDEPTDPYAGTAYAGQDIPFRKDDPVYRQFYDQPNPYAVNTANRQFYLETSTPQQQYVMRDQPSQRTLGLYERVTEQVSVELDGFHICYQLLNGTHQTGCQSDQDGNMGIVLYLEDIETIEYYEELCKRGDRCYNFIVVAKFSDLQRKSVEILRSSTVVKGIILTERFSPHAKILSEDASCPNEGFSAYKTNTQWNQNHAIHPAGFRFLNWNKPMFHVENQSDVQIINDNCYRKFNLPDPNSREIHPPFCYAKLTQFMLSAGDARTCARRETLFGGFSQSSSHLCDPIEDENVISVLPPMEITDTDPVEVFLLAARMDAFSALTTDSGGDVSVLTSLIASLAVSEAVGKKMDLFIKEAQKHRRHLMFGFFNGESLGYIGSSRAVWDMQHKRFPAPYNMDYDRNLRPINITNIAVVMELQQIFAVKDRTYYVHTDWNSYITQKDIVDAIAYAAKNGTENVNIVYEEPTQLSQVPPSSCHSFLRENASIPCVVISSFNSRYQYNAVNSMSDRITPADKEQLAAQIKALASSALHASLGFVFNSSDYTTLRSDFSINGTYVDILIDCFIYSENWHTCKMFRDLLSDSKDALNIDEKRVYTGTSTGYINLVKTLVGMLLVQAVGTTKPTKNITSAEQCEALNLEQNVYRYVWLYDASRNASFCYRSSTYLTKAKSPAFEMEDYDWSTNRYSTWTESVWQPPKLTLFLVASDDWPLAIVVAAVVLVLSTIVAWKADEMWFESGPVRNDAAL